MKEFIPHIGEKVRRKILAVSQDYYKYGTIVFIIPNIDFTAWSLNQRQRLSSHHYMLRCRSGHLSNVINIESIDTVRSLRKKNMNAFRT